MKMIWVLMVLVGCANFNRTTLAISSIALAVDGAQTYRAARDGWHEQYEANPIMGTEPPTHVVVGYFVMAAAANIIVWMLVPEKYRSILPSALIAIQGVTIYGNITGDHKLP